MTQPDPAASGDSEWPDPTDWINRLYRQLSERNALYDAEPDAFLKRNIARAVLADIATALMEFPAFQQQPVHFPLKDLMHLLSDLDQGRDHVWATPVNVGGTTLTNSADGDRSGGADLSLASHMLTAQAITPDRMFTELGRCAALNLSDYPLAADRYARLALKAQAHCRVTLEALAKLHQPREQTVRHVHVNDGGQAIVAEQIHRHATGGRNDVSAEQSHATGSIGSSTKMFSQEAGGNTLPISSGGRPEAVPDARRYQSGRSNR